MKHHNLSKENKVFKALFLFAIPLIISNVLAQSYNIIDLIVAGRVLGTDALSATGSTSTFIQFVSSFFWGFGVAMSTVIGELYGKGDKKGAVKAIKTGVMFIAGLFFLVSLFCFIFAPQILTWLKVDPEIFDSALLYFRVYIISLFLQALGYQVTSILHGVGNSKFPMVMTSIAGVTNVAFNLIFIIPCHMGVEGLAYATIISSGISFVLGIIYVFKIIKDFGEDLKPEFDLSIFKFLGRLAIPCIIQQTALYFSSIMVQPKINGMGKAYSAGYSVAMNYNLILNAVYHALSRSTSTYTSQCKGSGKHDKYTHGILCGCAIQAILITPLAILTMIFPNQIFSIFLKNNDSSCLPYATSFAYCCLPFIYFICYGNLMHSFYKSVEATKTVVFTTAMFTVARIGFTYLLPDMGNLVNIYLALAFSWVVEAILLFAFYVSGTWKAKEIKEFELKAKEAK